MCPRDAAGQGQIGVYREKKETHIDGQATLVPSSAGTGNNRGWLGFNGRDAQYALPETTESVFLPCASQPLLSLSSLCWFFPVFLRGIVPTPWNTVSPSTSRHSRAYLVYSFNTSLSNRLPPLLQLQYRARVLSRSPRSPATSHWAEPRCFGNRSPWLDSGRFLRPSSTFFLETGIETFDRADCNDSIAGFLSADFIRRNVIN